MSKKCIDPPAASKFTIRKIVEYLDEDPEVIDMYLFRFYCTWGEEAATSLLKFVVWAFQSGKEYLIKPTLLHDFGLRKEDGSCPKTSGY